MYKQLLTESIINKDIYLISDTHFFHKKIGEYCNRPDNWQKFTFENWNDTINDKDVVLHLGDLTFGNKHEIVNIIKQLKGQKFLIRGNHDRYTRRWVEYFGFHLIKNSFDVRIDDKFYVFSHRPVHENDHDYRYEGKTFINIHGHHHNKSPFIKKWNDRININCSVEVINYRPIKFSYILERLEMLDA